MTLEIALLKADEVQTAAAIVQQVFGNFGTKMAKEFARSFKGEAHPTHVFLARKDGVAVGLAGGIETFFSFNIYGLCWFAVLEEHRSQGIGTVLMTRLEEYIARDLLKGVRGTVILSASLTDYYEKFGYSKQPHPLHDGAFLMSKIVNA